MRDTVTIKANMNISISICVTETGQIFTLTISTEDQNVFREILLRNLREQDLTIEFEEGENPFSS